MRKVMQIRMVVHQATLWGQVGGEDTKFWIRPFSERQTVAHTEAGKYTALKEPTLTLGETCARQRLRTDAPRLEWLLFPP